jgi:AcrR family transcriptional regulator
MGHIERKIREKEIVRNNILAAARKIAATEGWQAVTIRKIADAIEYTSPIVYEHFQNKEDLIRELVTSGYRLLLKEFEKVHQEEPDPKKQLMQLSIIQWDFAFKNTELYQLMFSIERPQPNEEARLAMFKIKDTFMKITGKQEEEVIEVVFNWMCLITGTINNIMLFQGHPRPNKFTTEPFEMYKTYIQRFIKSIS